MSAILSTEGTTKEEERVLYVFRNMDSEARLLEFEYT